MFTHRVFTRTGVLRAAMLLVALPVAPGSLLAVEPGVDLAVPRMSIIMVDGVSTAFHPNRAVVEQSDYVRWSWTGGSHTTTSGAPCTANGLWSSSLISTVPSFTRQFADVPATYPFFCSPHCAFGMTGNIVVTTDIQATVTDASGAVQLDWTGGAVPYRVYRSDNPAFTGPNTVILTGPSGTQTPSFLDANAGVPPLDHAFFYLVMDQ
jgi:plastocyanin